MSTPCQRLKMSSMLNGSFFSETSRTISPRRRSCSETWALDSASSSPAVATPPTSMARKANVVAAADMPGYAPPVYGETGWAIAVPSIPPPGCCIAIGPAPSSRFSSSGTEARCSASLRVIRPSRTKPGQVGVHRLHPDRAGGLHGGVDLVGLALADQVADRRGRDQHLAGDDAAHPVGGRQQLLGDDPLQGDRELRPHLALLGRREDVDDPVHRLRGGLGVQGGEDEVAGLGGGQRRGDRLQVAHLADQDHVGVLAQRRPQAEREVRRVGADLALVDDRAFVAMQELDRVLDREDVVLALGVDHVEHRRQGRRLARAGRAGDQDEAARPLGQIPQNLRHAERVQARHLVRDQAKGGADRAALHEAVDAEASDVGNRVGEVELLVVLEAFALVVVEDPEDHLARVLRSELREALHRDDLALVAHRRREAGGEVDVGGPHLDHAVKDLGEVEARL